MQLISAKSFARDEKRRTKSLLIKKMTQIDTLYM